MWQMLREVGGGSMFNLRQNNILTLILYYNCLLFISCSILELFPPIVRENLGFSFEGRNELMCET